MAQEVFKRYEKKYMLTAAQYKKLCHMASDRLVIDEYGKHTICNIYFDTDNYSLIRSSIEKPVYKEKLRLRSYGIPTADSTVFLEIKKKFDGIVYKRRTQMTLDEAYKYINGEEIDKSGQILNEIDWFMNFYKPVPKVYLAYDRVAMYDKYDSSVRVTFDTNIRWRDAVLGLENGAWGAVLLDEDKYIMEIKISGAMPMWLSSILDRLKIYPASYSKYGTCYSDFLSKNIHSDDILNKQQNVGGFNCA